MRLQRTEARQNAVIRHSGIVCRLAPPLRGTAAGTVSVRLLMFSATGCRGCVQNPQFLKNKEFSSPASLDALHRRRVHARNSRDLLETCLHRKVAAEEDVWLSFHTKRVSQGLPEISGRTKMPMYR
jgi:hypothetical protein